MAPRSFGVNMVGRIRNFNLPKARYLLPLYEAVVNSINAIDERRKVLNQTFSGEIEVIIVRDENPVLYGKEMPEKQAITGFRVIDNGIGFNEDNLTSFMESDSAHKAAIGGKGVGRFSWLKAFKDVHVESIYQDDNTWVKRTFNFSLPNTDIDDVLEECSEENYRTEIALNNYLEAYQQGIAKETSVILNGLIEHCLQYILMDLDINIILIDNGEKTVLNDIVKKDFKEHVENEITIGGHKFNLRNIKLSMRVKEGNNILLCANNRLVEKVKLDGRIANLDSNLFGNYGFNYVGILSGEYLDESVDMTRLCFNFPTKNEIEDAMFYELDKDTIINEACHSVETYLEHFLTEVEKDKLEKIETYIKYEAPRYNHLMKYMPESIKRIPPNISKDALDTELNKIDHMFDKKLQKETRELITQFDKDDFDPKQVETMLEEQLPKITDAHRSALTEYMLKRKIILDLFRKGLMRDENGKRKKEAYLHSIIYPMRKTSNENIGYEEQNLWLVDERLSYCRYISSDCPLNKQKDKQRPDIYFVENTTAVSDELNDGKAYGNIVLFEFKRPMRDNYTLEENPITQLLSYVDKFTEQKVEDSNGRIVKTDNTTQFYLYVIADLTPTLKNILKREDIVYTPDGLGGYKFFKDYNAYVEILSYDKVANDAEKRNRILFDKLGINW